MLILAQYTSTFGIVDYMQMAVLNANTMKSNQIEAESYKTGQRFLFVCSLVHLFIVRSFVFFYVFVVFFFWWGFSFWNLHDMIVGFYSLKWHKQTPKWHPGIMNRAHKTSAKIAKPQMCTNNQMSCSFWLQQEM